MENWRDKINEITDTLEQGASVKLTKATAYHEGYVQACEDFVRAMRLKLLDEMEEVR